ncbi:hypothetical protein LTR64_007171 [Lithohypha guttulata]|uniref:uncharacterized protein n=1 Tax=Lithohypha guttulata TaxID=1690604 RepID=UPI002DDDCDBC|nr:hypothetical protein LTR51_004274 [Lithohypha guttulata]
MASDVEQALTTNPPPKSPYFTLPDVQYLLKEGRPLSRRERNGFVSISSIWGPAKKMTDEKETDFLLALLKHSKWEPDFESVAKAWHVSGPSAIKSRLKAIVEKHDYKLEGESKITGVNDTSNEKASPSKNARPEKPAAKKGEDTENNIAIAKQKTTKPTRSRKRKAGDDTDQAKRDEGKKRKAVKKVHSTQDDATTSAVIGKKGEKKQQGQVVTVEDTDAAEVSDSQAQASMQEDTDED